MRFTAVDVETANADLASICSIGIAHFDAGVLVDTWYTLVDPEDYFDTMNVSIHGITNEMVVGQPRFLQIAPVIYDRMRDTIIATHSPFDRIAIGQAAAKCGYDVPSGPWLDTARVARRTWPKCAKSGYGLKDVCRLIEYSFDHHNALEDAKACGQVLLAATRESNIDLTGWLSRVERPIDLNRTSASAAVRRAGDPDGHLFGEVVVFTGAMTVNRADAADMAAKAGCKVDSGVTKKTTLLVVGDTDIRRLAGHEKSSKHRKAEELAMQGQSLRILRETDFLSLIAT